MESKGGRISISPEQFFSSEAASESRDLHSFGEQLLADFVLGKNRITFSDLEPFWITAKRMKRIRHWVGGRSNGLLLTLPINTSVREGDFLKVVPKQDQEDFYRWVDVYRFQEDLPENEWLRVSTCRLLKEEKRFISKGWNGPERQMLLDFLEGDQKIQFKHLQPMRFVTRDNKRRTYIYIGNTESGIRSVNLPLGVVSDGDEVMIKPEEDERGIYQYLSVYRESRSDEHDREFVTSVRLSKEGLVDQRRWYGPERQVFLDFLDGVEGISFDWLQSQELEVAEKRAQVVNIGTVRDSMINLVLSKSFGVQPESFVRLVPHEQNEDGTFFDLVQDERLLGRYKFDFDEKVFQIDRNFIEESSLPEGFVSIKEGLFRLHSFLYEEQDFNDLRPFVLPIGEKKSRQGRKNLFCFKLRMNDHLFLKVPDEIDPALTPSIYAIPKKEDEKGKERYYWIDFYVEASGVKEGSTPINSCRLFPDSSKKKIECQRWRSLEEQLLVDFIMQKNDIHFEDLSPFSISSGVKTSIASYNFGGNKGLGPRFGGNPQVEENDTLLVVPKRDEERGYQWIDILMSQNRMGEEQGLLVGSCLLLPDEHRMTRRDWYGSERQFYLDFLLRRRSILFSELQPLSIRIQKSGLVNLGTLSSVKVRLKISGRHKLKENDEVVLIPERKSSEWVDFVLEHNGQSLGRYRFIKAVNRFFVEDVFSKKDYAVTERDAEEAMRRLFGEE